jgi:hypothetical protein
VGELGLLDVRLEEPIEDQLACLEFGRIVALYDCSST